MGAVMVKCPETGHDIPTGIVADRKSFDATPVLFRARLLRDLSDRALRQLGCARPSCPRDHLAQRLGRAAHNAGRPFRQAVRIALALFGKLND